MSATGRGRERVPSDLYETPHWIVDRLLEAVKLPGGLWVDPCAGRGKIIAAARRLRPDVEWCAVEILPELRPALEVVPGALAAAFTADFLTDPRMAELCAHATVVLTNPPYSLASQFLDRCREVAPNAWIVFLLRVNFLASEERAEMMRTNAPDMYVLPNRPSYVNDGKTDATEYAWFMWQPEAMRKIYGPRRSGRHTVLGSTPLEVRRAARDALPRLPGAPTIEAEAEALDGCPVPAA